MDDDGKNEANGVVDLFPPIVAAFLDDDDDDDALRDLLIDSIEDGIRRPTLDGDDVTLLVLSTIDDD